MAREGKRKQVAVLFADLKARWSVNVGFVYRLTRNLAIDAGFQTSVAGRGPAYLRTGLSVLWQ